MAIEDAYQLVLDLGQEAERAAEVAARSGAAAQMDVEGVLGGYMRVGLAAACPRLWLWLQLQTGCTRGGCADRLPLKDCCGAARQCTLPTPPSPAACRLPSWPARRSAWCAPPPSTAWLAWPPTWPPPTRHTWGRGWAPWSGSHSSRSHTRGASWARWVHTTAAPVGEPGRCGPVEVCSAGVRFPPPQAPLSVRPAPAPPPPHPTPAFCCR